MSRDDWKKVLGTIPNDELVELIDIWMLQIKGFRQITKDNIQTARAMAIVEALKPKNLNKIKTFYDAIQVTEKSSGEDILIREEDLETLKQSYDEGLTNLHVILGVLYASDDTKQHERAREFEKMLLEAYDVKNIVDLMKLPKSEHNVPSEQPSLLSNEQDLEWEKKKKKLEEKNQKLLKNIATWENQYAEIKKQFKDEKQHWIREKAQLLQELGREKSNASGLNEKQNLAEEERKRLKEEIHHLKAEISRLNALMLNSTTKLETKESQIKPIQAIQDSPAHVALVGDPKNKLTEESENPIFHLFGPKDINEALEKNVFESFDEVWIMTYLVPPLVKRKIKKIHNKNIVEFKDFPSMKRYIEKGR